MIKQVIIIRKDLNMRKGKMVAQGAHASMAAILDEGFWGESDEYVIECTDDMTEWLQNSFTKICVGVDSLEELEHMHELAMAEGIPNAIIKDSGKTEFGGEPTFTAVAIGPADESVIDEITGDLKLL